MSLSPQQQHELEEIRLHQTAWWNAERTEAATQRELDAEHPRPVSANEVRVMHARMAVRLRSKAENETHPPLSNALMLLAEHHARLAGEHGPRDLKGETRE